MAGRMMLRRGRWVLLAVVAAIGHWLVLDSIADHLASQAIDATMAPRLQAVYVRQLVPAEPPRVAAPAAEPDPSKPVPRPTRRPAAASPAASPPEPEPPPVDQATAETTAGGEPPPVAVPADPIHDPVTAAADTPAPVEPASGVDGADAAPAFTWPASTRVNYLLTGSYRGEVHGSAQVEWINAQPRYQVNLDVTIGLPFAPLLSRQMRSDGLLGPSGLQPLRYDQRSKMAFQQPRVSSLRFLDNLVATATGRVLPMPTPSDGQVFASPADFQMSVQDSASQFVQLTWLFTTQPHLLAPGTTISLPLALPGRVADWRYQVGQAQTLHTSFGPLEAFRVHTAPGIDRRLDLLAEAWFAPQLSYLPARIRIEQDAGTYIDLMIADKPELAAR